MAETRDWGHFRTEVAKLLERRTGKDVAAWNRRVRTARCPDEEALRAWLANAGVSGYPQSLLVYERFGYPSFLTTPATDLVDAQFHDRRELRPIYDAVVSSAEALGEVTVQARKSYVSLLTPKRTFLRLQASARDRLDVGLRLGVDHPTPPLFASRIHPSMPVELRLPSLAAFDPIARGWVRRAYDENL